MSIPTDKSAKTRAAHAVSPDKAPIVVLQSLFRQYGLADFDAAEASALTVRQTEAVMGGDFGGLIRGLLIQAASLRWLFATATAKALESPPEIRPSRLDAALAFQSNELRALELVRDFAALGRGAAPPPSTGADSIP
ncbi:MAG: hypothetical protein V4726_24425 [Verrucomicrobiota bacterium]